MKHLIKKLAVLAALAGAWPLAAETTPAASTDEKGELVNLSPFVVSDTASSVGRYTSLESISAGRVRADIMDLPQSVSVITGEMLQDVAGLRIIDTTRYAAGVADSTLVTSWERTNIRGFQGDGRTVDGITYGSFPSNGFQNIDPAIIERIEVVKGPNSILAPQPTSPGGTINNATKKPQFHDFGVVYLQAGAFDANSGYVDVNRVVSPNLAFRFVGSVRGGDHWWQGAYLHSTTLMPEFTYRFSPETQATFQYVYTDWKAQNYFGLPVDPSSGTTTKAHILNGVPLDLNVSSDAFRATRQHELKLFFTSRLAQEIQMRLVAAYNTGEDDGPQINTGSSTGGDGGNVDPLTGLWNSGLRYGQTPPYAPSPLLVQPTRIYTRSGVELVAAPRQFNFQNDYAFVHANDSLTSTTLAGFAYAGLSDDNSKTLVLALATRTFDIDHFTDTTFSRGPAISNQHLSERFEQVYISESVALLHDHLILNAAGSWQSYRESTQNLLKNITAVSSPHTSLPSYGVVLKPYHEILSLYYAHTEQSSANVPSTTGVFVPPLSTSRQDEFGARCKVWASRLYFTVAHYAIVQDNFASANPGNIATPPPNPPLPPLFSDRRAEGWEYELHANPSPGLSIVGSYTSFRNRDPNNVEYRGVAEHGGGFLASYAFDKNTFPVLDGFRIAVGVDYRARVPGDTASGFTVASTPTHLIPNQPSFYLDARTLVNLTLAYDSKRHWGVQVNVDNLLNQDYLMPGPTRYAVFPGTPTNIRVSVRYLF